MYNESDCQKMAQVATSSVLRITLSVTLLFCFLCLPVCFYALWRIQRSTKLHFNSKCVLFTHNFFVLIHCAARIGLHGKDVWNYFDSWQSGCDIIPSRARCELRIIYRISEYVIEVSPFILTIERFVATFQAHHYENHYKWCGILLCILHFSLAAIFLFFQTSTNTGPIIIFYCWLANAGNQYLVNFPTFFIFFSQLATIPGLLYLLRKNEIFRETSLHKNSTLTERYQISENLRTSSIFRIMSVVTWIYVAYNAGGLYIAQYIWQSMSLADNIATVELVHCLPMYYIILSILIRRVDIKPRSEFVLNLNNHQPHYFNDLQKSFDEAFEKIRIRKNQRTIVPMEKSRIKRSGFRLKASESEGHNF